MRHRPEVTGAQQFSMSSHAVSTKCEYRTAHLTLFNQGVKVCFPDSNITLQSGDGRLFKVHRVNLEMHSQVFADAASISGPVSPALAEGSGEETVTETIPLSESGETVELMLQYMYLQPQPNLSAIRPDLIADLAEAVEKYIIYAAMGVCSDRMRYFIVFFKGETCLLKYRTLVEVSSRIYPFGFWRMLCAMDILTWQMRQQRGLWACLPQK